MASCPCPIFLASPLRSNIAFSSLPITWNVYHQPYTYIHVHLFKYIFFWGCLGGPPLPSPALIRLIWRALPGFLPPSLGLGKQASVGACNRVGPKEARRSGRV